MRATATRSLVWLGVSCAFGLLPGCNSAPPRGGHGGGGDGGEPGASGAGGAMETGGSSGATGIGGAGAIVACAAGQSCPAGFICVPDPRATCTAGTPCSNVCLSGRALASSPRPPSRPGHELRRDGAPSQLTVAMGRAGDDPDLLLQPEDLLELFPLLSRQAQPCSQAQPCISYTS